MLRSVVQRCASILKNAAVSSRRCLKTETGIVGLPVDPRAREHLREKILSVLETIKTVPDTAEYRKNVESTFSSRLHLVESTQTDEAVEDELGIQLEQAIKECSDELGLIPKMVEWQPWDVPADYTVDIIIDEEAPEQIKA